MWNLNPPVSSEELHAQDTIMGCHKVGTKMRKGIPESLSFCLGLPVILFTDVFKMMIIIEKFRVNRITKMQLLNKKN